MLIVGINKEDRDVAIDLTTGLIAKGIELKNTSLIDTKDLDKNAKVLFDVIYESVISTTEKAVNEQMKKENTQNDCGDDC